jgi:hypothetical protein
MGEKNIRKENGSKEKEIKRNKKGTQERKAEEREQNRDTRKKRTTI